MSRNSLLVAGGVGVALAGVMAFGLLSSDEAGIPAGVSDADSPVVTVYKSPT